MRLWSEIKTKVFGWLTNRILPESGSDGQIPVKQSDGSILFEDPSGGGAPFAVSTGLNDYSGDFGGKITSLDVGLTVRVKITNRNTSSVTFKADDTDRKSVFYNVNAQIPTGFLLDNQIIELRYDGTAWQLYAQPNEVDLMVLLYADTIDDSGGTWDETDLNNAYSLISGQRIIGTNGIYEFLGAGNWFYYENDM